MVRKTTTLMALLLGGAAIPAAGNDSAPAPAWIQASGVTAEGLNVARQFGAIESVQRITLSPQGGKIAYVTNAGDNQVLMIADLVAGGQSKQILNLAPTDGKFGSCRWATETRLACSVNLIVPDHGQLITYTKMFALDSDGSHVVKLTREAGSHAEDDVYYGGGLLDLDIPGKPGTVLMMQQYSAGEQAGNRTDNSAAGFGVDEVNTVTLERHRIEMPSLTATRYFTDGHGTVRLMGRQERNDDGYLKKSERYYYRLPGSREWKPLSTVSDLEDEAGFHPRAVDAATNVVYGFEKKDGRDALYSISLDGLATRKLIAARPDVDIDGLVGIGRSRRIIGTSYATERRAVEYFDPGIALLSRQLSAALPGHPVVSIIDSTADESKLLIEASSDTNPGMVYLYTKATRHMEALLPVRAELAQRTLATVTPITYTAADGTAIPAYLTLPPGSSGKGLPAIVMPHGGPAARDEWGFDWLSQFFAARGYAVIQPNYRGSTGYGAAWYKSNGFKSWRAAIGDVNDAGRWLLSQGIAAPGKLAIVGWSYGGYAALQSAVLDPDLFKAIVAVAPVTDLQQLRNRAIGSINFPQMDAFLGTGPHIREGSPAQNADRFKVPVLMFHGDRDQNVDIEASRYMLGKLRGAGKQVELVEFPGLDHQLPSPAARTRVLSESDAVLRRNLGLPAN